MLTVLWLVLNIYFENWISHKLFCSCFIIFLKFNILNLSVSLWLDGFGTFLQSRISLDVVPTKSLQRSAEEDWRAKRIKMKINRNQSNFSLWISDLIWWISSDGSLMDLWWFVSFCLSTFDVVVQGNTPYDPFAREGLKKFHEVMCL